MLHNILMLSMAALGGSLGLTREQSDMVWQDIKDRKTNYLTNPTDALDLYEDTAIRLGFLPGKLF